MSRGVLLVAHGSVDRLDDLPAFLANIRRGHPAPAELVAEVKRRYEAIGGLSPLNATNLLIADRLEARLGLPVRTSNRLWHPYPKEALADLVHLGVSRIAVVPLAQHSAHVYAESARSAASEIASAGGRALTLYCAKNWGQNPLLIRAYAEALRGVKAHAPKTTVVMTAHSLPVSVIEAGDPYEREVRASAESIASEAGLDRAQVRVHFQSQGMSTGPGGRPMEWLGPDLKAALDDAAARGDTRVVIAPIGFLADHVEILYDIDIEAKAWAKERGLTLERTASLNASEWLLSALSDVATSLFDTT